MLLTLEITRIMEPCRNRNIGPLTSNLNEHYDYLCDLVLNQSWSEQKPKKTKLG